MFTLFFHSCELNRGPDLLLFPSDALAYHLPELTNETQVNLLAPKKEGPKKKRKGLQEAFRCSLGEITDGGLVLPSLSFRAASLSFLVKENSFSCDRYVKSLHLLLSYPPSLYNITCLLLYAFDSLIASSYTASPLILDFVWFVTFCHKKGKGVSEMLWCRSKEDAEMK